MATSFVNFSFKLVGVYWDPSYNPNDPWDVNTPDAIEFDEHGYWFTAGEADGRQLTGSKVDFIADPYKLDYKYGYEAGVWKQKVFNQG